MLNKCNTQDTTGIENICKRCNIVRSIILVRGDWLCKECFSKYVHTKVIKRMESFRVRNSTPDQQRTLLLPISFGVSSVTLLHILDHHLRTQEMKTGRTGFNLQLVHIDCSILEGASLEISQLSENLRLRYPGYELAIVDICDASALVNELSKTTFQNEELLSSETKSSMPSIASVFRSLPSPTSRSDMLTIFRRNLVIQTAKEKNCEAILWADSTTTLSEKVLAETAKGRGFSLPWQISDGELSSGVHFLFPMRELLKKEIDAYASLPDPPIKHVIAPNSVSSHASIKNNTIDELMRAYIHSVEENYPSIVANVLRTSAKLKPLETGGSLIACKICCMPIEQKVPYRQSSNGDSLNFQRDFQDASSPQDLKYLCYGCARATQISQKGA